jgi:uroporphyrinogen-III decarboxylase
MALNMDFEKHNAEVDEVWKAYHAGSPSRVPMILGISSRYTILGRDANPKGISFEDYFLNPDVMFEHQLQHQWWIRHNLIADHPMGLPDEWAVNVDFQNSYEAMWFGCELKFMEGECPDTVPLLKDDNKRELFDRGIPDPFGGWMAKNWEYLDHFAERAKDTEFMGRPVKAGAPTACGTDGIFTVACNIRGATQVCLDMYTDPDYYHELMTYILEATIARVKAYRKRLGQPVESRALGYADDSILLLSEAAYREFVLPYHKRYFAEFGADGPNSIHLCGDATRHFKTIRDELKVNAFDTGFPVDFAWLREELGPDVTINGGPHVEVLRRGPAEMIDAEAKRILQSGVTEGGKFIFREGNNLAPHTPPEHVAAMYEACKRYGGY